MPNNTWNVEWLNHNANRSYPLDDKATGIDTSGAFTLPKAFLLDLAWPVHAAFDQPYDRFHIVNLISTGQIVICNIGYTDSTNVSRVVGSFQVERESHTPGAAYRIVGVGEYWDSVGHVSIGDLDSFAFQGGSFVFDLAGARLAPTCIRPALRGVSALRTRTGLDVSDLITGDIRLEAGSNIRLTVDADTNTIRIDAISGVGLEEQCDCAAVSGIPIRTINLIPPDADGNFTLVGDDCITLTEMLSGLQLKDECSSACCGCDELTVIVDTVETMEEKIAAVERARDELRQAITQMDMAILASKTNAEGC